MMLYARMCSQGKERQNRRNFIYIRNRILDTNSSGIQTLIIQADYLPAVYSITNLIKNFYKCAINTNKF